MLLDRFTAGVVNQNFYASGDHFEARLLYLENIQELALISLFNDNIGRSLQSTSSMRYSSSESWAIAK